MSGSDMTIIIQWQPENAFTARDETQMKRRVVDEMIREFQWVKQWERHHRHVDVLVLYVNTFYYAFCNADAVKDVDHTKVDDRVLR